MPPHIVYPMEETQSMKKDFSIHDVWRDVSRWFLDTVHTLNDETIMHPYFMALALIVVWAWPHILALPIWFGKDAYRRIEYQTRSAANRITGNNPPTRRRDRFIARYRSIVNASYDPPSEPPGLFGGTPLHEGDFALEEERALSIPMRVIRWLALAWAVYILGREWYYVLSR